MYRKTCALLIALALPAAAVHADVVTAWNDVLLDAVRTNRTNPPRATRAMAIVHVSIHDAASSIDGTYNTYLQHPAAPEGASIEAAVAAAAFTALDAIYPEVGDALYAEQLAAIADGAAKDDGIAWGEHVAQAILDHRASDGSTTPYSYNPPLGAWWWTATPPAFGAALLPEWPYVTPWAMHHGAQFRAPGPPATPSSPVCRKAFEEVRRLGRATGSQRDADQTEIALFWNDGAGTQTPPGHWMEIAGDLAASHELDLVDTARTMALVAITVADAAISSWDSKYHFHHWRPVTAIQNAANDGNPLTTADPTWTSLIGTPPFPTYTSGHSTFSGSSSRTLAHLFGDNTAFAIGSDGLPGVTREFSSLSQAAEEAGQSRIYGGIHWQYDNRDALAAGRALGDYVVANYLGARAAQPAICADTATTLCLQDRFLVEVDWRVGSAGPTGVGTAHPNSDVSGTFSFFNEDNLELIVKVLDGCAVNGNWWVYAAPATNVELVLRVTDTNTGHTETFFNPFDSVGRTIAANEAFACN